MENFTVRDLGESEQKSVQEIEQQLLDKHEESLNKDFEGIQEEVIIDDTPAQNTSLKDDDVLSYIKTRYNKEVNSIEDLFQSREEREELPEDVSAYFKFKKETGRGIDDFVKLNRNFDDLSPESLLAEYYSLTEEDLDKDDIAYMIEEKFSYDEDFDDPKDIKKKEIAKKKELAKAKKYFDQMKETYKTPLESKGSLVDEADREQYNAYKKYIQDYSSSQEQDLKRSEYFQKKTDDLFTDEFKGFDFEIGDKKFTFLPDNPSEIKKNQSNVNNFIMKFLDQDGFISDPVGYHKSLAMAMNPDKIAKFFYEQGKSDALLDTNRSIKNIDMEVRNAPQSISNSGFKVVASDDSSGRGLKIRSNKK